MRIYVASSWRNETQPLVVRALRDVGHEVYDFKNPKPGDNGFHWSDIDKEWKTWTTEQFKKGLESPIAAHGFDSDMSALEWASACGVVFSCGGGAHLRL